MTGYEYDGRLKFAPHFSRNPRLPCQSQPEFFRGTLKKIISFSQVGEFRASETD